MHNILAIRLYFPLDALHVSDCVSPSSGATFISCTAHLVNASTISCVAIATQLMVKVAPADGLTQSETRRASNGK